MIRVYQAIDLAGQRFGKWTVLRRDVEGRPGTRWFVRCDCGREKSINGQALRTGKTNRCRECREPHQWRAGQKVGMRTLLRPTGSGPWIARCNECGALVKVTATKLLKHACRRCAPQDDTHGNMVTVDGETHSLAGWARKLGISRQAVWTRVKNGMSPVAACTTPRSAA